MGRLWERAHQATEGPRTGVALPQVSNKRECCSIAGPGWPELRSMKSDSPKWLCKVCVENKV